MSDNQELENPIDEQQVEEISIEEGFEALRRIHSIERQMLSRAIKTICDVSKKSAEVVVQVLAEGLDEEYENAMKSAYASAKIVNPTIVTPPTSELYIPKAYLPKD
jgi:23S rRNA U2552 (ribose-2'-O)-methylase RlmE/FtsJ